MDSEGYYGLAEVDCSVEEVDLGAGRGRKDTKVPAVHWGDEGDHNLIQEAEK